MANRAIAEHPHTDQRRDQRERSRDEDLRDLVVARRVNAAAARIRIAMLISAAITSDAIVSMRDMPIAERMLAGSRFTARVCTIDECRYRLCGITVAPRMPSVVDEVDEALANRLRNSALRHPLLR
ncbi:hypothetical protein HDG34_005740 [Paraburkholderia sp. HC6.4b]|nr:hypothetical protein [Paraburkholderia sp. HC6.4b]MBB5450086.1 hypothetical protein [Paraburkholderia sp. Kb1A]